MQNWLSAHPEVLIVCCVLGAAALMGFIIYEVRSISFANMRTLKEEAGQTLSGKKFVVALVQYNGARTAAESEVIGEMVSLGANVSQLTQSEWSRAVQHDESPAKEKDEYYLRGRISSDLLPTIDYRILSGTDIVAAGTIASEEQSVTIDHLILALGRALKSKA